MVDRGIAPAGAGRLLPAEAERRIAAAVRTVCRLDCPADNARLRRYYEDAGYTVVGEQPAKHGDGGKMYGVTLLEKRPAVG